MFNCGPVFRLYSMKTKIVAWFLGLLGASLLGAIAWLSLTAPEPPPPAKASHHTSPIPAKPLDATASGMGQSASEDAALETAFVEQDIVTEYSAQQQMRIETKQAKLLAALDDALLIEDKQQQGQALTRLCYQWAELDPLDAIELAFDYQLEHTPGLLENLAQQWAVADFDSARTWVDSQPPSDIRSTLVARIGYLWAQRDPASAADYVVSQIKAGPIQTEAAISVLHQWAQRDVSAARAWAEEFPSGAMRERALHEVAANRYQQQDTAALQRH